MVKKQKTYIFIVSKTTQISVTESYAFNCFHYAYEYVFASSLLINVTTVTTAEISATKNADFFIL